MIEKGCTVCILAKDFMYGALTLGFVIGVFDAAAYGMFFWDGIARILGDVGILGIGGLLMCGIAYCFIKVGMWTREQLEKKDERKES